MAYFVRLTTDCGNQFWNRYGSEREALAVFETVNPAHGSGLAAVSLLSGDSPSTAGLMREKS